MRDSTSTRKIEVTQVPPDRQQSHADFSYEEAYDIAICGNKRFTEFVCDKFNYVNNLINSIDDDWLDETIDINDLREKFTDDLVYFNIDIEKAKNIREVCKDYHDNLILLKTAIKDILSIIDDEIWESMYIHGSTQGDWQEVFYNTKTYTVDMIKDMEIDYFNLGTEWKIDEGDGCPWYIYCHKDSMSDIKKEILEELGEDENDVEFKRFVQYIETPEYEVF